MQVCIDATKNDPATAGDLWIQALTYFRDISDINKAQIEIKKALDFIIAQENGKEKKEEILSPLLVLEILKSRPNLKYKVIKQYLLNRLEIQDGLIVKNTAQVNENMEKIKKMRNEIHDLKTQAKNFNPKKCDSCQNALQTPTIHFMCGHTFHD